MQYHVAIQWEAQRGQVYSGPEAHAIGREEIIEVNKGHMLTSRVHRVHADRVDSANVDDVIVQLAWLSVATLNHRNRFQITNCSFIQLEGQHFHSGETTRLCLT